MLRTINTLEDIKANVQIGFGSYVPLYHRGLQEILTNGFICAHLTKNEKFIKNIKILINEQNEK